MSQICKFLKYILTVQCVKFWYSMLKIAKNFENEGVPAVQGAVIFDVPRHPTGCVGTENIIACSHHCH